MNKNTDRKGKKGDAHVGAPVRKASPSRVTRVPSSKTRTPSGRSTRSRATAQADPFMDLPEKPITHKVIYDAVVNLHSRLNRMEYEMKAMAERISALAGEAASSTEGRDTAEHATATKEPERPKEQPQPEERSEWVPKVGEWAVPTEGSWQHREIGARPRRITQSDGPGRGWMEAMPHYISGACFYAGEARPATEAEVQAEEERLAKDRTMGKTTIIKCKISHQAAKEAWAGSPRMTIQAYVPPNAALTQDVPALLIVSEEGGDHPEVFTKEEVKAILLEIKRDWRIPARCVPAMKEIAAKHNITLP